MKNVSFNKIAIVAVSLFAIGTSNAFADQPYPAQSSVVSVPSSQAPVTRAQVKSDLKQLEAAGFDPSLQDNGDYPSNLQAAEHVVAQQQEQAAFAATTINSVGSDGGTVSVSGSSSK